MMIVVVLIVALVGIASFAATKPDTFTVQRFADIKAPPESVYELLEDFHRWPTWAPHDKMDPMMKRTFGGAAHGIGAMSEWVSKGKAGSGRMEITESTAPLKITVKVDFIRPFEAHNVNEFTLQCMDGATRVTWTLHGTNPFPAKLMSVFLNMDRIMGKHFESGLRSLKILSEQKGQTLTGG